MNGAARLLTLALVAIALLGLGYRWGASATANARDAQQLAQERQAHKAVLTEVQRGERASGDMQAELLALNLRNETLERASRDLRRRTALLVPAVPRAAASQPGVATALSAAAGPAPATGCADAPAAADPGVRLSFGAVWLWNSALEGRDTPAGACGLADTSEVACAADSGVTADDAWDNQALNARLCAEDRLRHQRLIDFIKGRPH